MIVLLEPELQSQLEFFENVRTYYVTSRRYADRALAAWHGRSGLSDEQFIIAAYQASQVTGIGTNAENWAITFGGDQLRDIEDPKVRRNMELMLTSDYSTVTFNSVATPYRENVRRVIPIKIQDDIRRECGDRNLPGKNGFVLVVLPETCGLKIPPTEAASIAAALRARPDLVAELNWHLAAVAVLLTNAEILVIPIRELHRDLSKTSA